jgi:hypothetical protein
MFELRRVVLTSPAFRTSVGAVLVAILCLLTVYAIVGTAVASTPGHQTVEFSDVQLIVLGTCTLGSFLLAGVALFASYRSWVDREPAGKLVFASATVAGIVLAVVLAAFLSTGSS